ncbi:hypothetical protein WICANDRAFT_81345 [Wickerhamomyces anomalus NRRL Y-366-8]|uniref:Mitochondrial zinc maintenance protein 1, mitochondrial n=1 Tax=Wickerhamomyces anomalus (strain ATCC 58044 / CBS 1984 / NCYC 433 / NRRL Y-366-8) TaxID=683960 RepID=A0A1E3NWQ4_WICAA|nr:uncharacterized protein WICANDRAFT_81345 [Wickerhamomyces anomalus NRRL Y-366-8]ODQ57122.1 hypothetical protein WICANDRAFT_81345 [Wickerhamomyces anomalus NRRL Y-366-8]
MSRVRALAAYKQSFRATKIAFGDDTRMLLAARAQIKQGMRNPDPKKTADENIKHLEDVSKFLVSNIVQAKKNEAGKFRMNIHEQTELGDNESIKTAKKTLAAQNGGCCGGGAGLVQ